MMGERRIPHLRDIFSNGHPGWEPVPLDDEDRKKVKPKQKEKADRQDVKHLERHLSMKKTIRKKIMRELQQAWVEDPTEFKVEDVPREKLGAELRLESLSYGTRNKGSKNNSFLEFLRGQGRESKEETEPQQDEEAKTPFWKRLTTRRNKR